MGISKYYRCPYCDNVFLNETIHNFKRSKDGKSSICRICGTYLEPYQWMRVEVKDLDLKDVVNPETTIATMKIQIKHLERELESYRSAHKSPKPGRKIMVEGNPGMLYRNHKIFEWTDGGNSANLGYFDGAGELDYFFKKLFSKEFGVDVMSDVEYGTKCKITFQIETL